MSVEGVRPRLARGAKEKSLGMCADSKTPVTWQVFLFFFRSGGQMCAHGAPQIASGVKEVGDRAGRFVL